MDCRPSRVVVSVFVLAFVLSALPRPCSALPRVWREVGPPARWDHSGVYDPVGDRFVIFAGLEGATPHNEVWALSLGGSPAWSRVPIFNLGPSPRSGHTAIYDPVRQRMVVFGGTDDGLTNEVWTLSLDSAPMWTQLTPSGAPPSTRRYHTAIYDPVDDRMLVFGGNDPAYRNDVWELTLGATPTWTLLAPSGTPPSVRSGHSAIYDPVRRRMLVFGGPSLNDTWALDLAGPLAWSSVATSGTPPAAVPFHGAAYDPVRDRMLIMGGGTSTFGSYPAKALLSGTPTWQGLNVIIDATHAPAIYDPVRDRAVIHGGGAEGTCFNTSWALNFSPSVSLVRIEPNGRNSYPINDASGIFDPTHNRFVVFGGVFYGGFEPQYNPEAHGLGVGAQNSWTNLGAMTNPRSGHSASYVSAGTPRMVIFGGACWHLCPANPYNDVWQLPLDPPGSWVQLSPLGTKPAPRSRHTSIYDPLRNSLIVFGGIGQDLFPPFVRYNDVWELNLDGTPTWTQWTPLGTPPSARSGHSAIYDPVNQRMMIFGGRDAAGLLADAWSLSLTGVPAWSLLTPQGPGPSPREEHVGVYLPGDQRMLVFGGIGQADVWELSLDDAPAWTSAPLVGGGPGPDGRAWLAAAVDNQDVLWILGGPSMGPWKLLPHTAAAVEPPPTSNPQVLRAAPNPAHGSIVVGFSLSDRSPARLDLFDLSGRRIEGREVGAMGAGFHRLELGSGFPLAAGTYLLRLMQGGRSYAAKAVVIP